MSNTTLDPFNEDVEVKNEDPKDFKTKVIHAIQEMESEDFSDFYDKIKDFIGDDEIPTVCPESKIAARDWVLAFVKMKEDIEFYKKEYIPALTEKYITPVKDKIEQLEKSQDFIKDGLMEFLSSIGEKKVSFPDLATVSEAKTPVKVIYPENEEDLIKKILEEDENSEYIVKKPSLDKKKILNEYKEKEELPFDELLGEAAGTTLRVTVAKSRK